MDILRSEINYSSFPVLYHFHSNYDDYSKFCNFFNIDIVSEDYFNDTYIYNSIMRLNKEQLKDIKTIYKTICMIYNISEKRCWKVHLVNILDKEGFDNILDCVLYLKKTILRREKINNILR